MRLALVLVATATIVVAVACDGEDQPRDALSDSVATQSPTPTPTAYPRSVRTGWAEVDYVLALVDASDATGLRVWFLEHSIPCSDASSRAPSPPPCDGHPEGTNLPAFSHLPCGEGTFVSAAREADLVAEFFRPAPAPYAVTLRDPGPEPAYTPKFSLFFFADDTFRVLDLNVRGRIVSMRLACHQQPFDQVLALHTTGSVQYVLTPPGSTHPRVAAPTPTPTPAIPPLPRHDPSTRTGDAGVDATLDAVFSRETDRLASRVRLRGVPCAVAPRGIGAPPECPAGSPEGTLVMAVTAGGCEGHYITADDFAQRSIRFPGTDDFGLYAVIEQPEGGHLVVFSFRYGSGPATAAALRLDASGLIIHFDGGCAEPVGERHIQPGAKFLLPPPKDP